MTEGSHSAEDFQAATERPAFPGAAAGVAAYRLHAGLYRVVRT